MIKRHLDARSRGDIHVSAPPDFMARVQLKRRVFFYAACLGLLLVFLNVLSGIISSPLASALPVPASVQLKGSPSTPNTASPTAGTKSLTRLPHPAAPGSAKPGTPQIINHNTKMPMQAGSVDLQVSKAVSFTGSDGRLELDIPVGAITAQDLKSAGGKITVQVTQIAPASGSNAGGSGEFSLGSYLVQLEDTHGHLLSSGLRKPLTARYHIQKGEHGIAQNHTYLLLNGAISSQVATIPGVIQPANASVASTMGARQVQTTTLDPKAQTLAASPMINTPTASMSFNDDSPIASFGKPDPTSVNLSAGALSYSEPINLPAGPGGLTPPVSLTYSSAAVNGQHNPSAAASWVGEGWNLSLGSISWSESNVLAGCAFNACQSNGVSQEWESVWNMGDPYGTSSQLIPPNINVATYYDATGNVYCGTGNSGAYPCPVLWHTASESHDKIYSYVGSLALPGQSAHPPCWRVWLPNGTMEEFGCTMDSLQYYYTNILNTDFPQVSGWNLDMITDPQGNQIHITYQQDMENWTDPLTNKTFSYPRDTELSTIQYDSPGCHNAQAMCTSSSWAPQMQVVFDASHAPSILTGTPPTNCNTGANLRCDDPKDLSGSLGAAAPLIQSTSVLNAIQVQVRPSGSSGWNTLSTYQLGYEQSGPSSITDPASGLQRSVAGMLDLTQFQEVGSTAPTIATAGSIQPGASVHVIARTPTHLDAFWAAQDGSIDTTSWDTSTGIWATPWIIAPASSTQPGAPVNVVARTSTHMDLFWAGKDGSIDSAAWDASTGWGSIPVIAPAGSTQPGGQVSVVARTSTHMDLFWAGKDGSIDSAAWDASAPAPGWGSIPIISPAGSTEPGAPVNVVARTSTHMDLFWVGKDGSIDSATWDASAPAPGWGSIPVLAPAGSAQPGGAVTVVARYSTHMDLFWSGQDGSIETISWDASGSGDGWASLGSLPLVAPAGSAQPGSAVTVVARYSTHMDLFWSGQDGSIETISWDASSGWNILPKIALAGSTRAGGAVTVVARTPSSMYVFWATPPGAINSAYWDGTATNIWTAAPDGTTQELRSTALPLVTFYYSSQFTYYVDSFFKPNPATNCGPSWNTGNGSGCLLWEQNYAGNSRFLTAVSNGQGLSQGFTWSIAHNNSHGAPGGGANNANPFACDNNQSVSPCPEADDSGWSQAVLTQKSSTTIRLTQAGQNGAQSSTPIVETTNYSYQLNALQGESGGQQCSDCLAGMYWGNQNDDDYLGFYNGVFMGFAQATVDQPTGAVDVHDYYSGQGWGIYDTSQVKCATDKPPVNNPCHSDPWWNLANAAHGSEYETQYYDADGKTLLKQVNTTYTATCPPSGVGGTPSYTAWGNWDGMLVSELDHNNPVAACDVHQTQQTTQIFDGASNPVSTTTNWTYDNYGRATQETTTSTSGLPATKLEAESLPVVSSTAIASVQSNCCGVTWSGGAQLYFQPTAANNSFTLSFSVPSTGMYRLAAALTKAPNYGIQTLSIDGGNPRGEPFDGYNSSVIVTSPVDYGDVFLRAGTHTVTLNVTGKNSASTGYQAGVDYFLLTPEVAPSTVVNNTTYVWNDTISATQNGASGTYIIDTPALKTVEDGAGNRLSCGYTSYDGQNYTTGQTSSLTGGLSTTQDAYTGCGFASNNYTVYGPGLSRTTTKYDTSGNALATSDPDANGGISGHTGCTINGAQYSTCTTMDSTFNVFPTASANALNQTSSTSYGNTSALYGYGTWPASTTDANNQTTSVTYDALGRMTGITLPNETSGDQTKQWVYTNWCSGTSAQTPCEEIDEIDRLNSGATTTTRAFYDGAGRLVETRAPGPVGQDVVTYANYDSAGRQIFKSNPYFVTAYTGVAGWAAYSIPDSTQPGTSANYYPNAGITTLRTTSVTDPNSHTSTTTASVICGVAGTSDTGCYGQTMVVDANGHEHATLVGGLGKTNYTQTYTGTSGSYALYATTKATYDAAGNELSTVSPDGSTTTGVYDGLGHVFSQSDPDRGLTNLTYDPNGNVTQSVDARGSTGTFYTGYDGLNRPLWQNSTNSPTGAWTTMTYDSTANGNIGVGRMTGESFTGSGGLSGSYAYTYDGRGQQTAETVTVNGTAYPIQATYNDNGQATSQTYPTGEVVTPGYDANDWLLGLNTKLGTTTTTIASNLAYSGLAGAAGQVTSMALGSGDIYSASYDTGMRLTSAALNRASDNTLLYSTQPAYDAANNVVSVQTNISGQTDNQQFCYDSLNRMTWSGSTGIPPCASLTPGTLTAAQYQQSSSFNVDGGLTSGPNGGATYGNSSHPHALMSTSNGYSAAYDAVGNETCRSLTTATTCSGTQTGQQLSYDAEGRLTGWQNKPSSPTSTANYLYDGAGQRVAMQTTANGTTTLTTYIGSIEQVQKTGSTTTTTTYYAVVGKRVAASINGVFDYFGYDTLGSQVLVLNNSGNVIGSQLYGPYGNQRYSFGTLPTSIGFTGQQADSVTGLDYYNARYYDPVAGQFLSADIKQGNGAGMDPYSYVAGNPETATDPTGQKITCGPEGCGGGGGGGGSTGGGDGGGSNPCELSGGNPAYCGGEGGGGSPSGPPPSPGCHGGCKVVPPTKPQKPIPPTHGQIQHAKSVAGTAATVFGGIGTALLGLSFFFAWLAPYLLSAGAGLLGGLFTAPIGVILIAAGAMAMTLAWQARRLTAVSGALVVAFVGEMLMPDSWWTPGNVRGFEAVAGTAAGAVSDLMAFVSMVSNVMGVLKGGIVKALINFPGLAGRSLMAGQAFGGLAGFLSGEGSARVIDHYINMEEVCLTQTECDTV